MKLYGQLESAQLECLSSDPSVKPRGRLIFQTTQLVAKIASLGSWIFLPSRYVSGTAAAPTNVTSAGITPLADGSDQTWFVQGSGGAVIVSANPRIVAGKWVGQKLLLKGCSDANTLRINNAQGMDLNGDWLATSNSALGLTWDGTNWSEDFRR